MSPRRVAVITGSRAEFGLLEPVLRAIAHRSDLEAQLIVTGMHLLPQFGRTIREIRNAGWKIDATVRMQGGQDTASGEPLAVSRGISGIARALHRLGSQVVVVLGDRIEAFAGASAAALGHIALAHIHGGDRALGQTDDALRNAISRLAHVHLVASEDARQRLIRMGEQPWRIHRVGAPGLDEIMQIRRGLAGRKYGHWHLPRPIAERLESLIHAPYAVVVQHPASPDAGAQARTMRDILSAVRRCGLAGVILYPNSDPGHSGIIRAIAELDGSGHWLAIPSLSREDYLRLARNARVLIGNSSSGIIESASLGVHALNVGSRQAGRLRCGPGVIDVTGRPEAILRGLRRALRTARPRPGSSVYGDGKAGPRIARVLASIRLDGRFLRKQLAY